MTAIGFGLLLLVSMFYFFDEKYGLSESAKIFAGCFVIVGCALICGGALVWLWRVAP